VTLEHALCLASALSGALGTISLFKGSFVFDQPPTFGKPDRQEQYARNLRRLGFQKIGLSLILLSFVLEGIAQF
jgi:hypothetical protein